MMSEGFDGGAYQYHNPAPYIYWNNTTLAFVVAVFAAFCVWLVVRIVNRKERWAMWTLATIVGIPLLYVLSFGPVCRMAGKDVLSPQLTYRFYGIYGPLVHRAMEHESPFGKTLHWWSTLWHDDGAWTLFRVTLMD
ncbi:MAG: hypothetical protein HY290_13870 [Planctomycetia bacterium]|nr:hypothetical protein [Planctomycetia bacterium]